MSTELIILLIIIVLRESSTLLLSFAYALHNLIIMYETLQKKNACKDKRY